MCGRMVQAIPPATLAEVFNIEGELPNLAPSWNLAPKQPAGVVRHNPQTGERVLSVLQWGLVPSWADADHTYSTINAKAEELENKRFYRDAWRQGRRCIVPVDAFYEWRTEGKGAKQPYAIARDGEAVSALAGLWESKRLENGEVLRTFTIITCAPNNAMEPFHDRMPVILDQAVWSTWLETANLEDAARLMQPCPDDALKIWPVSRAVGNVRNNGLELLTEYKTSNN